MRVAWVFSAIFDQYVVICRERCILDTKLLWVRVSTTPGYPGSPENLLEFKNPPGNPGNLLEFNGPPGNFCVRCSTALVIGHKTGYQIA